MYCQTNFVGNVSLLPLLNNLPFLSFLQAKHVQKNRKNMSVIKCVFKPCCVVAGARHTCFRRPCGIVIKAKDKKQKQPWLILIDPSMGTPTSSRPLTSLVDWLALLKPLIEPRSSPDLQRARIEAPS